MNTNKKLTFILSIFLSITFLHAQTNTLEGKITEIKTGTPVQGAIVFISNNLMSYSDNNGRYQIRNIPEGKYSVKVSRLGFNVLASEIVTGTGINVKDFQLSLSPIELDEVIVSTDRTENFLRNSAYSELLIGSDEIAMRPFHSIPDILKNEPGINLLRDGIWGTEVNIRGLSRENVVTLINGSRIVTSTDVAARLSLVDMNDIDRIEIIKGASSAIYGSGATGGIINLVSKMPEFRNNFFLNGSISGGYNSVNSSEVASGSILTGDAFWSAKLTGSYRNAGNTQTPAGELFNSQFEDYSISAALNLKPFEDHLIKLNYQLFRAEDVGIPGASVFPGNAVVRYPDEEREMVSAQYEVLNISKLFYKLSARYSYQLIDRNVENIPNAVQNVPGRRVSVLKITPHAVHRNNNVEVSGNFLLGRGNNLTAGIDYWDRSYKGDREKYQKIEILNQSGEVTSTINKIIGENPLPDSKMKNFGLFLQNESEINSKLSLSFGLRGDRILISGEESRNPVYEIVNGVLNPALKDSVIWEKTETKSSSYSANTGFRYSVTENTDLTLSLGLSFRSPSLEERFQFIDQGNFVRLGNPALNSELGRSADLGFRFYFSDFRFVSSVFYNYFTNLVAEEPGLFEGRPAFIKTNVGRAALYGFDLSAEYNFFSESVIYTAVSYVKGDDITLHRSLPGIPPLNSLFGVRTLLLDELTIDASSEVYFKQDNPAPGELSTPGYGVFDLSFISRPFDFHYFNLQLFAGVENIFDKSYRNHLATTRGNLRLEPGRNFYFKLITRW